MSNLVIGGGILLILLLASWVSRSSRHPHLSVPTKQDRDNFLGNLQSLYKRLDQQSLQGAEQLELELIGTPDAVDNLPEQLSSPLFYFSDQPEAPLSANTSIMQVYIDANRELLILGEAGTGKSTLLRMLAQQLIRQAQQDSNAPLPVIFPLSSWANKCPPLYEWLVEQLASVYHIPPEIGRPWVQDRQILPLLDGLDEMAESGRPNCIVEINTYHNKRIGKGPLVVCSRSAEYTTASTSQKLVLQKSITVQPLTSERVHAVLAKAGESLSALQREMGNNPALQELATYPLWLNILLLTYQNTSIHDLPTQKATLQQQIFASYVQHMLNKKGDPTSGFHQHTIKWLSWLAQQMRQHNQTLFLYSVLALK